MVPLQALFRPALVLTNTEVDRGALVVHLTARKGGLLGLLLDLLSLGTVTDFRLDATGLHLEANGFLGRSVTFVPRGQLAASVFVTARPTEWLAVGIFVLIWSTPALLLGLFAARRDLLMLLFSSLPFLAGVGLIGFFFFAARRVTLGVVSTAGTVDAIKLKASAGEVAELAAALPVMDALLQTAGGGVVAASGTFAPAPARVAAAAPAPPAGATLDIACPSCKAEFQIPAEARGRKVRCTVCKEVFRAEG